MVNENSGMVSLVSRIDRESLENSYFDLVIIATEVQQPNSTSSTSTTVFIDDINDNSPNFSQPEYVFYVDEDFYGQLSEQDITVSDPDLVCMAISRSLGSVVTHYTGILKHVWFGRNIERKRDVYCFHRHRQRQRESQPEVESLRRYSNRQSFLERQ